MVKRLSWLDSLVISLSTSYYRFKTQHQSGTLSLDQIPLYSNNCKGMSLNS